MDERGTGTRPLAVAVISGKGGVGKSTITASLAVLFQRDGESIVAVDCDVDAPNLALLFTRDEPGDERHQPSYTTEKSQFDVAKCTACKACVDERFCVYGALKWDADTSLPVLDVMACEGCGACAVLCDQGAYSMHAIQSGAIHATRVQEGFPLVFGETVIGASSSGKLVAETKELAGKIAAASDATLVLVDGPPGIGCPVLATVTGMDLVVVVTEPFPAALHDASRAIEVLERFGIPLAIIINRADAWDEGREKIMEFIDEHGYDHLGDIPIDMAVPKSVSSMKSVVVFEPASPASVTLASIHRRLAGRLAAIRAGQP